MAMGDRDGPREPRRPYLPSDYRLEETTTRDFVILRSPDGSEVAAFAARGADPKELERWAWEDFRGRA